MNNRGGRAHLQSSSMKNSIVDLTALCGFLRGSKGPGRMLVLERWTLYHACVCVCVCVCVCARVFVWREPGLCTLKLYHLILFTMRTNRGLGIHLRLNFWYLRRLKLSLPYPMLAFSVNDIMWINVQEKKLDSDPNWRPSPGPPAFTSYVVLIESFTLLRLSFHMGITLPALTTSHQGAK